MIKKFIEQLHQHYIIQRRVDVIAGHLISLIPQGARVLDVGSGDGKLGKLISEHRSDLTVEGIDVLVRENTAIPVKHFDGTNIPYPDNSFDVVIAVDVLHHLEDLSPLFAEMVRVSSQRIILKDHLCESSVDFNVLSFMDDIGNSRHGVPQPNNYQSEQQWDSLFHKHGLKIKKKVRKLNLYPLPVDIVFGRSLHIILDGEIEE